MPTGVFTITDIPEADVATVIADFGLENPPPVTTTTKQPNGLFTVTATFPGAGAQKKKFGS